MSNKLQIYLKVISLSGLMAFVILTSCNVRKGIQQLVGQEVQKQLIPSKTIQSQVDICVSAFDDIEEERQSNTKTNFDFSTLLLFSNSIVHAEVKSTITSIAQTSQPFSKVGLYLLFMQLKTHH
jgi:hypothetical protein